MYFFPKLFFVFLFFVPLIQGCKAPAVKKNIAGKTMGTTYQVSYFGDAMPKDVKSSIDTMLVRINEEVSTFIPSSTISIFNASVQDTILIPRSKRHFWNNYLAAKKVYNLTDGFFDPTVMPLVNYWGFGYKGHKPVVDVDSARIDAMLQFVGFDKVRAINDTLFKAHKSMQLDFSACAKGYAIDEIGEWFIRNEIENYYIEIGGENKASGAKPNGELWSVGLIVPKEGVGVNEYNTIIELDDSAMATSGNYRNYHQVQGVKYSHTINPNSGFSERNSILSASVLTESCLMADAFATGIMTMGYQNTKKLYQRLDSIQIILKIGKPDGTIKTEYWGLLDPQKTN